MAAGDLVYFLDDDTVVSPGFARRVIEKFSAHPETACIGGPNVPPAGETPVQAAVDAVLGSRLGAGPMRVRNRRTGEDRFLPAWCFMLCNLGVRRDVFARHGLYFPESCISAEENVFLFRAERKFGPGLFSPELSVCHERRGSIAQFCLQVFSSGQGRAQITRMEPRSLQAAVLTPPAFMLYLGALAFGPRNRWLWMPLGFYVGACLAESLRLAWRRRMFRSAALLPGLIFLGHLAYAAGLASGLFLPVYEKDSCLG
jgi:GT2 family glycosyltransferase